MKINKITILNILFILSVPFTTLLLCGKYEMKLTFIVAILSFISGVFIATKVFKKDFYKNMNRKYLLIAILFSMYQTGLLMNYSTQGILLFKTVIQTLFKITLSFELALHIVSALSLFSIISITYYLLTKIIPLVQNEYKKTTKNEKYFILIITLLALISTTFIYNVTTVFNEPKYNGRTILYDVIYTSDSGAITKENAYLNVGMPENDIRQPIFGVLAMPFATFANLLSSFVKFIPNTYAVVFNTIQIILIALALILITRMMQLSEKQKIAFWILSFSCYSFMLFSFVQEQYVFAFFYLILAIYVGYYHISKINYFYIAAVGSLLTSGIIFPLITKFKNIKSWIYNVFKCFIAFLLTCILSGQILQFATTFEQIEKISNWSGKDVLFIDRINQFSNFIQSIFIAPSSNIVINKQIPCFWLKEVTTVNIFGIIILILCIISFIINRKNKILKISFLWVLFSILLLCIMGWGSQENGMILYSLYFAWAYIVLLYSLFNKIIKNVKLKTIFLFLVCLVFFSINLSTMLNIIAFGINYYG